MLGSPALFPPQGRSRAVREKGRKTDKFGPGPRKEDPGSLEDGTRSVMNQRLSSSVWARFCGG